MSKTIFITSFHVLISRNILSTAIIPILQWGGVRIVVLVPEYKKDYFEKHFAGSNIIIEGIPANQPSQRLFGLMFKRLFQMMLPTRSIRILQGYRIYLGKGRWYRLFYGLAQFLGRRLWVIRMARFLDFHLSPRGTFRAPLEHYRPDIVFSTDVQNENDVVLMHDARRRRIPIVGMVRSWDNLTVLGLIRFLPDRLLVTSETMRAEAVRYNGVRPERISVVGIPHYDRYLTSPKLPRQEFFEKIHMDLTRPLIFYTPIGDLYIEDNDVDRTVLDILATFDANVIVRFPPADTVSNLKGFRRPPRMFFDIPGVGFERGGVGAREVSPEDDTFLMNALYHSDLVVTGPSTIAVEAALFDKPIILINFQRSGRPYFEQIYGYDYDHMRYILKSGGVRVVRTERELREWIDRYLADPSRDREGRARIVETVCWRRDAQSSQRVARAVLAALEEQP